MNKKIVDFLIRAKRATYAGKGAETASSRIKSHDLVYRENDLMYYDTYLGGEKFAGEEALWIADVPYWSMNYVGRVTGSPFSGDFLKEALLHVPEDAPPDAEGHVQMRVAGAATLIVLVDVALVVRQIAVLLVPEDALVVMVVAEVDALALVLDALELVVVIALETAAVLVQ